MKKQVFLRFHLSSKRSNFEDKFYFINPNVLKPVTNRMYHDQKKSSAHPPTHTSGNELEANYRDLNKRNEKLPYNEKILSKDAKTVLKTLFLAIGRRIKMANKKSEKRLVSAFGMESASFFKAYKELLDLCLAEIDNEGAYLTEEGVKWGAQL